MDCEVFLSAQSKLTLFDSGEIKKFNVTFRKVTEYPVDLYYLMDLSNSMEDDLATLQKLGITLAEDIKNVTKNIKVPSHWSSVKRF